MTCSIPLPFYIDQIVGSSEKKEGGEQENWDKSLDNTSGYSHTGQPHERKAGRHDAAPGESEETADKTILFGIHFFRQNTLLRFLTALACFAKLPQCFQDGTRAGGPTSFTGRF